MLRFAMFLLANTILAIMTVQAARMPDKVEKEFQVEGQNAIVIINFLGFSSEHDGVYYLPWAQDSAQCFKEMKQNVPIYSPCDPTVRVNTLKYYSGQNPRVIFSGYWFDGETGTSPDVPKYFFGSPDITVGGEISDWRVIAAKFGKTLSAGQNSSVQVLEDGNPLIHISLHEVDGQTRYLFGIDNRPPQARKTAERKYMECVEWHKRNPLIDGGC